MVDFLDSIEVWPRKVRSKGQNLVIDIGSGPVGQSSSNEPRLTSPARR
jgi:hypothetical protein